MSRLPHVAAMLLVLAVALSFGQSFPSDSHGRNYDEAKVGAYALPDPLVGPDGEPIDDPDAWRRRRRRILGDFRDLMYGHRPELPRVRMAREIAVRYDAFDGLATREVWKLGFFDDPAAPVIDLLLYLPKEAEGPAPVLLGMSFYGNASIEDEPSIPLPSGWMRPHRTKPGAVVEHRATAELRGVSASRWPLRLALERGYGVATFYYGDVEPDHIEGWRDGIRGYAARLAGREEPLPEEWGAIDAWAWGLSRAMDFLQTLPRVDSERVAVFGHSRLGKAALWAGAQDERFALVISNDSGEGGASLARRNFGENIAYSIAHASWRYNRRFPDFIGRADELLFDQHMLLALVAPRPLYVASATDDALADPKGEYLAAYHAGPVYGLFGLRGLPSKEPPPPETPVGDAVGYHLRTGGHDITAYDWEGFLDFADRHFGRKASASP